RPPEPSIGGLAVLGMGTLGAGELTYTSDLDLIFVYDAGDAAWWAGRATPHEFFTRIAQRTISALQTPTREGIAYRIDTRLRPSGNQGSLVCSFEAFEAYHRSSAQLWERQALVKARVVAGPPELAARLEDVRTRFVYGRGLDSDERVAIARMRERIERERGGERGTVANIKTGRGGLVDVEFLAQALQLTHGHDHPLVRSRDTGGALAALAAAGLLNAGEARALRDAWTFLRALERRLRLERDQPEEMLGSEHGGRSAIFRLREHVDRLYGSAHVLDLPMPFPREQLIEACLETVRANRLRECYIRPIAFLGDGEMGLAARPATRVAVAAWPWGAYLGDEGLRHGIRVKTSSFQRFHPNTLLSKAKASGHYVNSILASYEVRRAGYDEALLLDVDGYVSEASGENVFIVAGGVAKTTPLPTVLGGITRDAVLRLLDELGIPCREERFTRDEVYLADEAFFTGTAAEVTPIRELDDRRV